MSMCSGFCALGARYCGLEAMSTSVCICADTQSIYICSPLSKERETREGGGGWGDECQGKWTRDLESDENAGVSDGWTDGLWSCGGHVGHREGRLVVLVLAFKQRRTVRMKAPHESLGGWRSDLALRRESLAIRATWRGLVDASRRHGAWVGNGPRAVRGTYHVGTSKRWAHPHTHFQAWWRRRADLARPRSKGRLRGPALKTHTEEEQREGGGVYRP